MHGPERAYSRTLDGFKTLSIFQDVPRYMRESPLPGIRISGSPRAESIFDLDIRGERVGLETTHSVGVGPTSGSERTPRWSGRAGPPVLHSLKPQSRRVERVTFRRSILWRVLAIAFLLFPRVGMALVDGAPHSIYVEHRLFGGVVITNIMNYT